MNKKIIVLVRRSFLEIEYILPILLILKKKFKIIFFFESNKSYKSLISRKEIFNKYKKIAYKCYISSIFESFFFKSILKFCNFFKLYNSFLFKYSWEKVFGLQQLLKKMKISDYDQIKFVMTSYDTSSQRIVSFANFLDKKYKIIFFPSSPQMIDDLSTIKLSNKKNKLTASSTVFDKKKRMLKYADFLLINSKFELNYWNKYINEKFIKIIGLPIFYNISNRTSLRNKAKEKIIVISYNCVEEKFQRKESLRIKAYLNILINFKTLRIFIKLHPEKTKNYIFKLVKEINSKKILFTDKNLLALIKNAHFHLTATRTAAISYSNYFKIPTLGYRFLSSYKFLDKNPNQVKLNLVKEIDDSKSLQIVLENLMQKKSNLGKIQNINFHKLYPNIKDPKNFILKIFSSMNSINNRS